LRTAVHQLRFRICLTSPYSIDNGWGLPSTLHKSGCLKSSMGPALLSHALPKKCCRATSEQQYSRPVRLWNSQNGQKHTSSPSQNFRKTGKGLPDLIIFYLALKITMARRQHHYQIVPSLAWWSSPGQSSAGRRQMTNAPSPSPRRKGCPIPRPFSHVHPLKLYRNRHTETRAKPFASKSCRTLFELI
jgi:hypothetical protein